MSAESIASNRVSRKRWTGAVRPYPCWRIALPVNRVVKG